MTLKVINHRSKGTRKIKSNNNNKNKHLHTKRHYRNSTSRYRIRRGGGGRSKSKSRSPPPRARARSRSRSRSRSPLPDSYPEDIKPFVGNVKYGYKILSDDDGNYTGVQLINLTTFNVVGDLKEAKLHNPDYMLNLEGDEHRFNVNDWVIDPDLDQQELNNMH